MVFKCNAKIPDRFYVRHKHSILLIDSVIKCNYSCIYSRKTSTAQTVKLETCTPQKTKSRPFPSGFRSLNSGISSFWELA